MQLRPVQQLETIMETYPSLHKRVEFYLLQKGKQLPTWPNWCFMPMAAFYSIISAETGKDPLPDNLLCELPKLAAIGSWQYTQGIYRFAPDFYDEMIKSETAKDTPASELLSLPESSLYIELEKATWNAKPLHGMWTYLEFDANTNKSELCLLLDTSEKLVTLYLDLSDKNIIQVMSSAIKKAKQENAIAIASDSHSIELLISEVQTIIAALLALCSAQVHFFDENNPTAHPSNVKLKKTKNGEKLYKAKRKHIWIVDKLVTH